MAPSRVSRSQREGTEEAVEPSEAVAAEAVSAALTALEALAALTALAALAEALAASAGGAAPWCTRMESVVARAASSSAVTLAGVRKRAKLRAEAERWASQVRNGCSVNR